MKTLLTDPGFLCTDSYVRSVGCTVTTFSGTEYKMAGGIERRGQQLQPCQREHYYYSSLLNLVRLVLFALLDPELSDLHLSMVGVGRERNRGEAAVSA